MYLFFASLAGVIVPSLVIGLTLLYASGRDAVARPEFRDWLPEEKYAMMRRRDPRSGMPPEPALRRLRS